MFSLKEKVIVVTGGCGLLGKQIVSRLRDAGAIALCADIYFDSQHDRNIHLDITNEQSVLDTIRLIAGKYQRIDGWINNAYPRTEDWGNKLEDVSFDSWRKNIDMHLNGYFLCSKVALNHMKVQGFGTLINMASIYGVVAPDFTIYNGTEMTMPVAYAAIKGGIINLTKYFAAYYGPYNIRVNAISPGGIFDNQNKAFVSNYNHKVPLRKMGKSSDIAAAAHFLLSDDAEYITGHNLIVDGGWTAI